MPRHRAWMMLRSRCLLSWPESLADWCPLWPWPGTKWALPSTSCQRDAVMSFQARCLCLQPLSVVHKWTNSGQSTVNSLLTYAGHLCLNQDTLALSPAASSQSPSRAGCSSFQQGHLQQVPPQPAFQTPRDRAPKHGAPTNKPSKSWESNLTPKVQAPFLPATSQLLGGLDTASSSGIGPQKFNRFRMTVVNDPLRSLALRQDISVLLRKGTIEYVESSIQSKGFLFSSKDLR